MQSVSYVEPVLAFVFQAAVKLFLVYQTFLLRTCWLDSQCDFGAQGLDPFHDKTKLCTHPRCSSIFAESLTGMNASRSVSDAGIQLGNLSYTSGAAVSYSQQTRKSSR